MASIDEFVQEAERQGHSPQEIATGLEGLRADVEKGINSTTENLDERFHAAVKLGNDISHAHDELRVVATDRALKEQFPEEADRQAFLRSFKDGKPPEEYARQAAAIREAVRPFEKSSANNILGSLDFDSNRIGSFNARPLDNGNTYEVLVKGVEPAAPKILEPDTSPDSVSSSAPQEPKKQVQVTRTVTTDRKQLYDAVSQRIKDQEELRTRALQSIDEAAAITTDPSGLTATPGGDVSHQKEMVNARFDQSQKTLAKEAEFYRTAPIRDILKTQLLGDLKNDEAFKSQIPDNLIEQYTARPALGLVKSLAQTGAAVVSKVTDSPYAEDILHNADTALKAVTPGQLQNRFEGDAGGSTVADSISSGVESMLTFMVPGQITKIASRLAKAVPAARGLIAAETLAGAESGGAATGTASIAQKAGFADYGATAFGQSYAQRMQAAAAEEDPVKANEIKTWAPWLALVDAGVQMISEKLPLDERITKFGAKGGLGKKILAGGVLVPLNEAAEGGLEYAMQQFYKNTPGTQDPGDLFQVLKDNFMGGLAFAPHAFLHGEHPNDAANHGQGVDVVDTKATEARQKQAENVIEKVLKPVGITTQERAAGFLEEHNAAMRLREENPDNPDIPAITDAQNQLAGAVTAFAQYLPNEDPASGATKSGASTGPAEDQSPPVVTGEDHSLQPAGLNENPSPLPNVNPDNTPAPTVPAAVQPQGAPVAPPAVQEAPEPVAAPQASLPVVEAPPAAAAKASEIERFAPGIVFHPLDTSTPSGGILSRYEEASGRKVVLYTAQAGPDGHVTDGFVIPEDPNTIYMAANTVQPFLHVLGHETSHTLENMPQYPGFVSELQRLEPEAWQTAQTRFTDSAKATSEFVADVVGSRFARADFWDNLQKNMNPGAFQRFVNFVKSAWDKIKTTLSPRDLQVNNVQAVDKMIADLLQAPATPGEGPVVQNASQTTPAAGDVVQPAPQVQQSAVPTQRLGVEETGLEHDPKEVNRAVNTVADFVKNLNPTQVQAFLTSSKANDAATDALTKKLQAQINRGGGANFDIGEIRLALRQIVINSFAETHNLNGFEKAQLIARYEENTRLLSKAGQVLALQKAVTDYVGKGGALFTAINDGVQTHVGKKLAETISDASLPTADSAAADEKVAKDKVAQFNQAKPAAVAKNIIDIRAALEKLKALQGIKQSEIGADQIEQLLKDLDSDDPAIVEAARLRSVELFEQSDIPSGAAEEVAKAKKSFTDTRSKNSVETDAQTYQDWLSSPKGEAPVSDIATVIAAQIQAGVDAAKFDARSAFNDFLASMKENTVGRDVARTLWPEVRRTIETNIKSRLSGTSDAAAGTSTAFAASAAADTAGVSKVRLKADEKSVVEDLIDGLKAADTLPDRDVFIAQFIARFPTASDTTRLKLQAAGVYDNVADVRKRIQQRLRDRAEKFIRGIGAARREGTPTTENLTWSKAVNEYISGKQGPDSAPLADLLRTLKMPEDQVQIAVTLAEMARDDRQAGASDEAADTWQQTVAKFAARVAANEARTTEALGRAVDDFVAASPKAPALVKAGANDFRALHKLFVDGGGFDLTAYHNALVSRGLTDEQAAKLVQHSVTQLEGRTEEALAKHLTDQARAKNKQVAANIAFETEVTRFVTGNAPVVARAGGNSYKDLHKRYVAGEFTNLNTYRQILKDKGVPPGLADTLVAHAVEARAARVAAQALESATHDQKAAEARLAAEIDASRRPLTESPVTPRNPVGALKQYMDDMRAGKTGLPDKATFVSEVSALLGVSGSTPIKCAELHDALSAELAFTSLEDLRDTILEEYRKTSSGNVMNQNDLRRELARRAGVSGISVADLDRVVSQRPVSTVRGRLGIDTWNQMLRNNADVRDGAARHNYYVDHLVSAGYTPTEAAALLLKKGTNGLTFEQSLEAEMVRRKEEMIKRVENASPAARERLEKDGRKLRDVMMGYLLSGDSALTAFAKATGYKMRLTPAEIARFQFLTEQLSGATTETERAIYSRQLDQLTARVGKNEDWKKILNSVYLASIYSAPSTFMVNLMAPATQVFATMGTEFVRLATYDAKNGGNFGSNVHLMIQAGIRAFRSGLVEARFAASSGILAQSIEKLESGFTGLSSIERQSLLNKDRIAALKAKATLTVGENLELKRLYIAQMYNMQQVVFKILGAVDSGYGRLFQDFFASVRQQGLLRKQGLSNADIRRLVESRDNETTRAAFTAEFRTIFPTGSSAELARYIHDRIRQEIDNQVIAHGVAEHDVKESREAGGTEARFLLGTNDFKNHEEDMGLIGALNKGLRSIRNLVDERAPIAAMYVLGPVTIVGNIANRLTYLSPAGFLRIAQATEVIGGKRVVKAPGPDGKQRNLFQSGLRYNSQIPQRVIEAWMGTLAMGLLATLRALQPKDPEDWWFGINLSGPNDPEKKAIWASRGNKPYTIWFGAGKGRISIEFSRSAELIRPAAVAIGIIDQREAIFGDWKDDKNRLNDLALTTAWQAAYAVVPPSENLVKFFSKEGPTSKSDPLTSVRNQSFALNPVFVPFSGVLSTVNRLANVQDADSFEATLLAQIPGLGPFFSKAGVIDTTNRVNGMGLEPVADRTWYNKLDKLRLFPLSYTKVDADEFGATEVLLRKVGVYPKPFSVVEVEKMLQKKLKNPDLELLIRTATEMTIARGKEVNNRIQKLAPRLMTMSIEKAKARIEEIISHATEKQNHRILRVERAKVKGN